MCNPIKIDENVNWIFDPDIKDIPVNQTIGKYAGANRIIGLCANTELGKAIKYVQDPK